MDDALGSKTHYINIQHTSIKVFLMTVIKANPNATNSELDAKIIIKYDETNQPEDWEDFWNRSIPIHPKEDIIVIDSPSSPLFP
tara:strand:+ start:641 stop:892 length:252 start_codon:yes stop_codon:yes gene_type:complete